MKALRSALFLLGLLAALPASAAPKHIIISDSLLANADTWEVKRGVKWLGIHKWRLGDYFVVSSKSGWGHSSTRTNLFKTKTESRSDHKFSFVLSDKSTDSAFVHAAHGTTSRANPGLKVGKDWTFGGDDRVLETDLFTASIILNRDTTETWALSIGTSEVSNIHGDDPESAGTHVADLTHGERHISLTPVASTRLDERPSFTTALKMTLAPPALGYEFIEDGQSLCALEYFSSGFGGSAKNTIWMRRNTDERMQLVLAAAMTALLELECGKLEGGVGAAQP